jgi:hypothetical protein
MPALQVLLLQVLQVLQVALLLLLLPILFLPRQKTTFHFNFKQPLAPKPDWIFFLSGFFFSLPYPKPRRASPHFMRSIKLSISNHPST